MHPSAASGADTDPRRRDKNSVQPGGASWAYSGLMFIRLGGVFTLVAVLLWLYAIFDALTAPPERVRRLPKAVWVIIVLLLLDIGAIAWFIWGRPRAGTDPGMRQLPFGRPGYGGPRTSRSVAPDDDPEFLKRLRENLRRDANDDDSPPG
jgi:Phospholipase_D-nuclease N-terminal